MSMTEPNGTGTGMTVKELVIDVRDTLREYVEKHDERHLDEQKQWQAHQDQLQLLRGGLVVVGFLASSGLLLFAATAVASAPR